MLDCIELPSSPKSYILAFLYYLYGVVSQSSLASWVVLVVKNPPANAGHVRDTGSIPRSERSPAGEHGNPLQDSCLENPIDRGAWGATVHGVTKSQT